MAEKQNFTTLLSKVILPKVEVIAIIISSIGFLLYLLKQTGAQQLLMIGLSTLASVFFLTANTLPPAIEKTLTETTKKSFFDTLLNFIWKIMHIALSVSVIGLLFYLLNLNGYTQMILIGTTILIIALLLSGIFIIQKNDYLLLFKAALIKGLLIAFISSTILYNIWPLINS